MERAIKFVSGAKQAAKLRTPPSSTPRLDPEIVQRAFNATHAGSMRGLDLFSVREAITRLLASNGGRPSVEGASSQVKIPRIDDDWLKIEQIANGAAGLAHKPSVTQTAALILHVALSSIPMDELDKEMKRAFG